MARFYLSGDNSRGNEVTAAGSASGQHGHLRGWHAGVKVAARGDSEGRDSFEIYATSGSKGSGRSYLVGTVTDLPGIGPVFTPALEMACPGCGNKIEPGDHIEGGAILCVTCDVASWAKHNSTVAAYAGE